jgi:anti-sigma B factor antagonist
MNLSLRAVHGIRDAVWVVRIVGDVEVIETPRLVDGLRTARQEGTGSVILDLRAARHVSSSAIHAVLSAKRRLAGAGRRLVLVCDAESVSMTLPLSGLAEVLDMYADVDAALESQGAIRGRPAPVAPPSWPDEVPPLHESRS